MGSIYRRGSIFWLKYYRAGKCYRESSHSSKESDAKRLLKLREGAIAEGKFPGLKAQRIRFEEIVSDIVTDYRVNNRRSLWRLQISLKHLLNYFSGMRVIDVSADKIQSYILSRKEQGASNGTINRELSALKRAFTLAVRSGKASSIPYIPKLSEENVRKGFFEYDEFIALRKALPSYLKPVVTMAYFTGMRRSEILSLEWDSVDLLENKIILKPENTKNKDPRIIYLQGELLQLIHYQYALRNQKFPNCKWVFFGKNGDRIKDFRTAWKKACEEAGLEGKLFHDFRRTTVRNMIRSGVPERVAMMISGHKTRSVFDRYNIVSEDDLRKASQRITEYHGEKNYGHNLDTIPKNDTVLSLQINN